MAADVTNFEELPARVDSIEQKLHERFEQVDKRFDEVSEHFVEQRQYTEFAFGTLRAEMIAGFARLERKLDQVIDGFNRSAQRRPRRDPKKR